MDKYKETWVKGIENEEFILRLAFAKEIIQLEFGGCRSTRIILTLVYLAEYHYTWELGLRVVGDSWMKDEDT